MSTTNLNTFPYPEWVVLHVPHDSQLIPSSVIGQFVISESELQSELINMTDHYTYDLYSSGVSDEQVVRAPLSRLVVDVERFEDDAYETMAGRGMGVIYQVGSKLQSLRRALNSSERKDLLDKYYRPHHLKLTKTVDRLLNNYGYAFLLDCHSFPSKPLPYEIDTTNLERTDICLGTDSFHTPKHVVDLFVTEFKRQGLSVSIDTAFAGTLVPHKHYQIDSRVSSLMIEINRKLYVDESNGFKSHSFNETQVKIRQATHLAFNKLESQ